MSKSQCCLFGSFAYIFHLWWKGLHKEIEISLLARVFNAESYNRCRGELDFFPSVLGWIFYDGPSSQKNLNNFLSQLCLLNVHTKFLYSCKFAAFELQLFIAEIKVSKAVQFFVRLNFLNPYNFSILQILTKMCSISLKKMVISCHVPQIIIFLLWFFILLDR